MAKPHLCSMCHEHPATVHYTEIVNNKLKKLNLCEHCAREKGLGVTSHFSVAEILKGLTEPAAEQSSEPETTCDFCGLSFSRFHACPSGLIHKLGISSHSVGVFRRSGP